MRLAIILLSFAFTAISQAANEKESKIQLVTAPSGEYRLEWTQPLGPLQVVSMKNSSVATGLDIAILVKALREESLGMPLAFISPDSNWVFVVGPQSEATPPESFNRQAILFRRTPSKDEAIHFEPAMTDRFDRAAWEFLDRELKLKKGDFPPDTQRVYAVDFIDWSRDSGRLLFTLASGVWSPPKDQWLESVYRWYCYFNTRTGKFELTDRLRFVDTRPERNGSNADETAALIAIVTNAESIGEEEPQRSPKDRFEQTDKRLNDVYGKLIAQTEPAKREALREEQRSWLVSRDTDAQVAAIQAWSFGQEANARILESKAISTEARLSELEKRLSKR